MEFSGILSRSVLGSLELGFVSFYFGISNAFSSAIGRGHSTFNSIGLSNAFASTDAKTEKIINILVAFSGVLSRSPLGHVELSKVI